MNERYGKRKRLADLRELAQDRSLPAALRLAAIKEYNKLITKPRPDTGQIVKESPAPDEPDTGLSDADKQLLG